MSRPRALVLTPRLPWPLDDGGRVALWQTVWSAARHCETTLLSMVSPGEGSDGAVRAVSALGARCETVVHRAPGVVRSVMRSLSGPWPYTLARYRSGPYERRLRELVGSLRPDFVLVNHLHLATYADAMSGVALVLREHNLEHLWLRRYAHQLPPGPTRAFAVWQADRLEVVEADLCRRMDLVLAIQEEERAALEKMVPGKPVVTLPVGVDFARFESPQPADPPVVLLAASFTLPHAVLGARRFLREVWPDVRAHHPTARLRLVGKNLPEDLADETRRAHGEPVGYVDSIAGEFSRSTMLVVPLWVGGGARVKIVEALAARLAVVSTTLGLEGLGLTPGVHALEADDGPAMAAAVRSLLEEPGRARALARSGYEFASSHFSLEPVARRMVDLCLESAAALGARASGALPR